MEDLQESLLNLTHLWGSRDALKGKVEYIWSYTTYIWLPGYFFITGM
jgi:hypothetical protein